MSRISAVPANQVRRKYASSLRKFLRYAVAFCPAGKRSRDFGSLKHSLVNCDRKRHQLCSMMYRQSGLAFLTAGQWTELKLFHADQATDASCSRCEGPPESLMHRLWSCPCDDCYRSILNSSVAASHAAWPQALYAGEDWHS